MAVTSEPNQSKLEGAIKWFDVRNRDVGMWAFALNRLSAIGLVVYLFLHLVVLSTLSGGPQAYDSFLSIIKSPVFVFGEWLVVIGGLYHGLNGIRIALTSFGFAVPYQKQIFYVLFVIAALASLIFGIRMFSA
jgi:succinate dehydrogenase / fumarate reductase cytochrome b subunit